MTTDDWVGAGDRLWEVLLVGTAAYVTLVVILRLSGKRPLAKLNASDGWDATRREASNG